MLILSFQEVNRVLRPGGSIEIIEEGFLIELLLWRGINRSQISSFHYCQGGLPMPYTTTILRRVRSICLIGLHCQYLLLRKK